MFELILFIIIANAALSLLNPIFTVSSKNKGKYRLEFKEPLLLDGSDRQIVYTPVYATRSNWYNSDVFDNIPNIIKLAAFLLTPFPLMILFGTYCFVNERSSRTLTLESPYTHYNSQALYDFCKKDYEEFLEENKKSNEEYLAKKRLEHQYIRELNNISNDTSDN